MFGGPDGSVVPGSRPAVGFGHGIAFRGDGATFRGDGATFRGDGLILRVQPSGLR